MEFIVAVENIELRARLVRVLRSIGREPAIMGNSGAAYRLPPQQANESWLLLETDDNVHRLTRIVYDLHYSVFCTLPSMPVTCFVSQATINQNPSLGFWLIDGGAAVDMILYSETADAEIADNLGKAAALVEETAANPPLSNLEPTALAAVVDRIANTPDAAGGWLGLAEALLERKDQDEVRSRVCETLLRRAVELEPGSARAHLRLGKTLFRLRQPAAAIAECREAVRLDPTDAEAHFELGTLLRRDAPDEARHHLTTADGLGKASGNARGESIALSARFRLNALDTSS